jgi:hypothetical protein
MSNLPERRNSEKEPLPKIVKYGIIGTIGLLTAASAVVFGAPEIIPQEILQQVTLDQLQGIIAITDIAALGFTASVYSGSFL